MTDIEDLVEAVFDIEDVVEAVIEPEELLEDLIENPITIAAALIAGAAAVFTALLLLLTIILAIFAVGFFEVVAVLTALSFVVTVLAVGGFLYFRTDLPSHVQQKVNDALEQADDQPTSSGQMSQEEAIKQLEDDYAAGRIDEYELEEGIDRVLRSDNPERALNEYEPDVN